MTRPLRLVQLAKTPRPKVVTLSGIKTLVNEEQAQKAKLPISVTVEGIVIFTMFFLFMKALSPILVTVLPFIVLGIVTDVSVPLYLVIDTVPF